MSLSVSRSPSLSGHVNKNTRKLSEFKVYLVVFKLTFWILVTNRSNLPSDSIHPFTAVTSTCSEVESHEGLEGTTTSRSLPLQSRRNMGPMGIFVGNGNFMRLIPTTPTNLSDLKASFSISELISEHRWTSKLHQSDVCRGNPNRFWAFSHFGIDSDGMSEWMAVDGLWGTAFKGASNHCFLKMDTSRLLCCWYVQFNFYTKESTIYRKHIETELIINESWIINHKWIMNSLFLVAEIPIFTRQISNSSRKPRLVAPKSAWGWWTSGEFCDHLGGLRGCGAGYFW